MTGFDRDGKNSGDKPALAGLSPAGRYDRQNAGAPGDALIDADDPDHSFKGDISRIPIGVTQNNQAFFSAMKQQVSGHAHADLELQRKAEDAEARELMHLAEWNRQRVTVGGVEMTNEEAQEARRRFIDNEDYYAKLAVQRGYIKSGEQEELKRWMRRKVELEDKKGRGIITDDEEAERVGMDRSKIGQAGGLIVGEIRENKATVENAASQRATANAEIKSHQGASTLMDASLFQSAPALGPAFAAAKLAAPVIDSTVEERVIPQTSREINATGLDI